MRGTSASTVAARVLKPRNARPMSTGAVSQRRNLDDIHNFHVVLGQSAWRRGRDDLLVTLDDEKGAAPPPPPPPPPPTILRREGAAGICAPDRKYSHLPDGKQRVGTARARRARPDHEKPHRHGRKYRRSQSTRLTRTRIDDQEFGV